MKIDLGILPILLLLCVICTLVLHAALQKLVGFIMTHLVSDYPLIHQNDVMSTNNLDTLNTKRMQIQNDLSTVKVYGRC